jgi:calcineurin-like phosphoesterase family protein
VTHKCFESIDYIKNIVLEGKEIVLCHYPLAEWNNYNRGSYHIYGYIHDFKANKAYQYMSTLKRAMNCGCMLYGYKPATFEELTTIKLQV